MDFIEAFQRKMEERQPKFEILGLLSADDRIYQIGTDTKVLSTAFELMARPLIFEIAQEHGLTVYEPNAQNYLCSSTEKPARVSAENPAGPFRGGPGGPPRPV